MKTRLFVIGAIAASSVVADTQSIDPGRYQLVDLSHAYGPSTVYWPTAPSKFTLHQDASGRTDGGFYYASNTLSTPEHGGTHLDAPRHFSETGRTADQVPLDQLIAPAVVIDVTAQAAKDRDYRLTREDVLQFEKVNGAIARGTIVLLRTGWSRYWPNAKAYLGDDTPGDASKLHFPSYGRDAAQWLVQTRQVAALGVDTASIDHGPAADFVVHQVAAAANVVGLENLTGLDRLPPRGAWVIALPMKIGGGSGAPLRVIALLP
jgi:kynurenine formamidase